MFAYMTIFSCEPLCLFWTCQEKADPVACQIIPAGVSKRYMLIISAVLARLKPVKKKVAAIGNTGQIVHVVSSLVGGRLSIVTTST